MYTCDIFFKPEEEKELKELCNNKLIHSISSDCSENNCIRLETRKLWKLYWFYKQFKKFDCLFGYYLIFSAKNYIQVPYIIRSRYKVVNENKVWLWQKTSIYFKNINDVWKIHFFMLFR